MSHEKLFKDKLKVLNEEFVDFISSAFKENSSYDFTPSVTDYLNHVKELDNMYSDKPIQREIAVAKRRLATSKAKSNEKSKETSSKPTVPEPKKLSNGLVEPVGQFNFAPKVQMPEIPSAASKTPVFSAPKSADQPTSLPQSRKRRQEPLDYDDMLRKSSSDYGKADKEPEAPRIVPSNIAALGAKLNAEKEGGGKSVLFGATPPQINPEKPSLFGVTPPNPEKPSLFGTTPSNPEKPSLFGATPPNPEKSSLFGVPPANSEKSSLFGTTPFNPEKPSLFGATPPNPEKSSLFGVPPANSEKPSLFGVPPANSEKPSLFGTTPVNSEKPSNGLGQSPGQFNFDSTNQHGSNSLFGGLVKPGSFTFNASGNSTTAANFAPTVQLSSNSLFGGLAKPGSFNLNGSGNSTTATNGEAVNKEGEDNGEAEDAPPPKVEIVKHEEPDAAFSTKCSLFNFAEGEYKKVGVGFLHIKKSSNGTQLLIRAATALGTVLVNTYINDSFKAEKKSKDKIQVSYPSTDGAKTSLIRVGESEAAETLSYLTGEKKP